MQVFRKGIIESKKYRGFYIHPTIRSLTLSVLGRVINLDANSCLVPFVGFFKYPQVVYNGAQYTVHRLMVETFLEKDENKPIVNHIDGNKMNPRIENLELTTYSGNITHAYKSGLRDDNLNLEVMNLLTGEKKQFYSLNETARAFEVNPYRISAYINSRGDAPFDDIFSIVKVGSKHKLTKEDAYKHRNGNSKKVVVVDDDGTFYVAQSVSDVARYFDVNVFILYQYLNGGIKSIAKHKIQIWYECDFKDHLDDVREIPATVFEKTTPIRQPIPITVENTVTGEVTNYPSAEAFAKEMFVCKSVIQKATKKEQWRGYIIRYTQSPLS